MKSICLNSAHEAPPILLQADRVRRRIAASDAVASLVADLCFGPRRRDDLGLIASVTASRVASSAGVF